MEVLHCYNSNTTARFQMYMTYYFKEYVSEGWVYSLQPLQM